MALELVESGTGLELIQLEIGKVLFENLNTEIDTYQSTWQQRDAEWQSLTGIGDSETVVELFSDENFHLGHRPSLIQNDMPKDAYPNIAVMAYESRPTDQIIDQATNVTVGVDIEFMVKSENSELEVDRRTHRTIEAIHQVLSNNSTLNGKILGWDNDPSVQVSEVFIRREDLSFGPDWYWQGARFRYLVNRSTNLFP
jgi:hypothetical protein